MRTATCATPQPCATPRSPCARLSPRLSACGAPNGAAEYIKGLTRDELRELLEGDDDYLLDAMETMLWAGVEELQASSAATGAELSSKFAAESDYALEYGDLEVFFQGLDGLLGPPSMHARRAG